MWIFTMNPIQPICCDKKIAAAIVPCEQPLGPGDLLHKTVEQPDTSGDLLVCFSGRTENIDWRSLNVLYW